MDRRENNGSTIYPVILEHFYTHFVCIKWARTYERDGWRHRRAEAKFFDGVDDS